MFNTILINQKPTMQNFTKIGAFMLMLLLTQISVGQRTVSTNSIFTEGGFTYEFWRDDRIAPGQTSQGTGSMTTGPNGTFTAQWEAVENILFRSGQRPGSLSQIVTYVATMTPTDTPGGEPGQSGTSYLTLYGWTRNPLVEWYVVENWWNWRPPGGTRLGTFTSDGGTYDVFRTLRENQPSIDGWQTFPQFWSVRQVGRSSGTITFANHINAWRSFGMNMGSSLYEVSLCIEGFRNNGTGSVSSLTFTVGSPTNTSNVGDVYLHPIVTVYPNPAVNTLNIRLEGYRSAEMTVNIFDTKGALVHRVDNAGSHTQLDVAQFDSGLYIIEVKSPDHISKHRFVKD